MIYARFLFLGGASSASVQNDGIDHGFLFGNTQQLVDRCTPFPPRFGTLQVRQGSALARTNHPAIYLEFLILSGRSSTGPVTLTPGGGGGLKIPPCTPLRVSADLDIVGFHFTDGNRQIWPVISLSGLAFGPPWSGGSKHKNRDCVAM